MNQLILKAQNTEERIGREKKFLLNKSERVIVVITTHKTTKKTETLQMRIDNILILVN